MAESDKPDSSTIKAKSKSSFLDEDLSNDFLSSWKSNSVTGGDDMDFNFEPVAKGKNKAFDFGMDMDFSLDDAFGKMPSFKFDMPDIDFSISPKKPSKSNEKQSEGESTEGSRQEKNAKFDLSFDFNGKCDDKEKGESRTTVITDALPAGGQTNDGLHFLDKGKMSIDIKSSSDGIGQTLHDKLSSQSKELVKQESAVEKKAKNADVSRDGDSNENGETGTKMVVGSLQSDGQKEKDEPHLLDNRKMSVDIKPSRSKEIAFVEVFGKIPSLKLDKPISDCCGSSKKPSKFNEKLAEESAKGNCEEKTSESSSPPRLTVKLDAAPIIEEEKVVGVVETLGNDNFTLDTAACSVTCISKSMNSEVASNPEIQSPGFENSTAPPDSKPTRTNPTSMPCQVPGANTFSMVRGTNDGNGMTLTIAESKKTGSAAVGASHSGDDSSHEREVEEFDDSPSSCAKEILKIDSAVEERGKNADISSDLDNNANEEIRTNMAVQLVPHDGEAEKVGLHLLDNKKMSTNDNCSGIRLPSLGRSKGISKSSSQRYDKLKEKNSESTVQNSSLCKENRLPFAKILPSLPSLRMPSLPSLKITRNTIPNKQSSSLAIKEPNAMGNLEKNPRLQVQTKMVSPVNVQKQTPSLPSLKRKPSEAADLRTSKRPSIESRKSEVPARDAVNNVTSSKCSEGTMLESEKNVTAENFGHEFDFRLEPNMENLGFTLMESDVNVEKAEACAKELDEICTMLKKKHNEAKELLVRALVNNNNLLMLNHPICEQKIHKIQRFASRLMSRAQEAGV